MAFEALGLLPSDGAEGAAQAASLGHPWPL